MVGRPRFGRSPNRGKSGLHGKAVPANGRRGSNPRESATENRPLGRIGTPVVPQPCRVRVKGCGKSAPRPRQRGRHGKPHREQDRIGAAGERGGFVRSASAQRFFRLAARVGRVRRVARRVPEEWSSIVREGGDRTRLTDHLAPSSLQSPA
ncbi:Hypothetical protein HVPorG_05023 [Roseomonas mucosa]|nr:Hypothetical protein HVPorG_05023 [Roseomonas mucosa]UZO93552.1 Hypothetical protein RMP42_05023 [Roseomonas mucosa]